MIGLLKKRRAKKQAEELARKAELKQIRDKNRAKRAKRDAERAALAEAKKAKGPGKSGLASAEESAKKSAEMRKFRQDEKQKQAATKRGLSNIKARRSAGVGEAYERTEADGTKRKMVKRDPSKKSKKDEPTYTDKFGNYDPSQLSSNMTTEQKDRARREKLAAEKEARRLNPKAFNPDGSRKTIERGQHSITKYGSKGKQTFRSKVGESLSDFKKRIDSDIAKNGGKITIKRKKTRKSKTFKSDKKVIKDSKGNVIGTMSYKKTRKELIPQTVKDKNKKMEHGGALAIMIAPVKTKKMKAVKKAPGGASMKKKNMSMYADGGKMPKYKDGGKLRMVKGPDGKMVPFYAADGKGKMNYGGKLKKMKSMYGSKVKMAKNGSKVKMAGKGAYMKK
tara:strand:- start:2710 stop:3888 length:1179 start_codon:yes stop_codon:yes gene_type:complete